MCTQSILLTYQILLNFNFRFFLGTIEQIRVTNITNSSNIDLGTFQVPDKWNAREHRLHFNFSHVSFYYIRSSRKCWERSQEGAYTCWDVAADISLSLYSESQINEYIARVHEMSSWNLFWNVWQRLCFLSGLHKKNAAEMFAASKGWIRFMKIYPNIIVASHKFFNNFLRNCFFYF